MTHGVEVTGYSRQSATVYSASSELSSRVTAFISEGEVSAALTQVERACRRFPVILIVGGVVLDAVSAKFEKRSHLPNDVDVVVSGAEIEALDVSVAADVKRTPHGGMRLVFPGAALRVDIWTLESTYFLRQPDSPRTVLNFLLGTPFNANKGAFDLHSRELWDAGVVHASESGELWYSPAWPKARDAGSDSVRAALSMVRRSMTAGESTRDLLRCRAWQGRMELLLSRFVEAGYPMDDISRARELLEAYE